MCVGYQVCVYQVCVGCQVCMWCGTRSKSNCIMDWEVYMCCLSFQVMCILCGLSMCSCVCECVSVTVCVCLGFKQSF